jgi:hypothetical protein
MKPFTPRIRTFTFAPWTSVPRESVDADRVPIARRSVERFAAS